jgi:hypothetical protein
MVRAWLAVKLPEEVAIMRRAAALTVRLEEEAYATIVPGVTRDRDLAAFLKRRMRELGVEDGWSPAQNPSVNSGPDRGHSHASDRVIQPGDVIQTDFGIKVHGVWVTDIQRFAYVLRPGESAPPPAVERRWRHAVAGGRAAFAAMRPGATGAQVDSAQRLAMAAAGSLPVPVGDGARRRVLGARRRPGAQPPRDAPLAVGHVLAFDGFHAWAFDERAGGGPTRRRRGARGRRRSRSRRWRSSRRRRRVPRAAAGAADPRAGAPRPRASPVDAHHVVRRRRRRRRREARVHRVERPPNVATVVGTSKSGDRSRARRRPSRSRRRAARRRSG